MSTCQQESLGRSIYLTSQTMRNYVERTLKPFDLTSEQFHLLKNMDCAVGRPQSELCDLAGKSPANITRLLDRLAKKDLVIRRDNPEDRRSSLVFQTENGQRLTAQVSNLFSSFSAEIEKGIKPAELTIVLKVLTQIEANINRLSVPIGE